VVLGRSRRPRDAGFTLAEVIIGLTFLLVIALATLPVFVRSSIDNVSGKESTEVSNLARSQMEEFRQLPFNSVDLTIDAGTEKSFESYYSFEDKAWKAGPEPLDGSDPALWVRTATVRQYSAASLEDGRLDPDEALSAATGDNFIHLKEVVITLNSTRTGALGPNKQISLRVLKSQ
jgi:type II secretory pathway pseudopilin PulG